MCGIVYHKSFRGYGVARQVARSFAEQRQRGLSGFGYYVPEIDRLTHNTDEKRILRLLDKEQGTEILFHHRWPTSTENVRNACHPFSTKGAGLKHQYVLVHNGHISNAWTIRADHIKDHKIAYKSWQSDTRFNDSEALLYDVALYLEGKQDKLLAHGGMAFVCIESDKNAKPLKLHFARNASSPLKMVKTKKRLSLTSEGNGQNIPIDTLHTLDYATGELTTKPLIIPEWAPSFSRAADHIPYTPNLPARAYSHDVAERTLITGDEDWGGTYNKRPIGFHIPGGSGLDDSLTVADIAGEIMDFENGEYDHDSEVGYYDTVEELGWVKISEYIDEFGPHATSVIIDALTDEDDSVKGKIRSIDKRLATLQYYGALSNQVKFLLGERRMLLQEEDIIEAAQSAMAEVAERKAALKKRKGQKNATPSN